MNTDAPQVSGLTHRNPCLTQPPTTHTHTPQIAPAVKKELRTAYKQKQEWRQQQPEPAGPQASSSASAAFGIVVGDCLLRVALEVDGQTLVVQHIAGQDQVFGLPLDAADAAGVGLAAHGGEGEGLHADAQVLLELPAALVAAHRLHLLQLAGVQEGLRGAVATQFGDVRLPLVLVQAFGGVRADVATEEGAEGVVPPGGLARQVVLSQGVMAQPETQQGQRDEALAPGHYSAYLERETYVRCGLPLL